MSGEFHGSHCRCWKCIDRENRPVLKDTPKALDAVSERAREWVEEALTYVSSPTWSPSLEREGRDLLASLSTSTQQAAKSAAASGLVERLKMEAQIHAGEARAANATIAEIYRIVTGSTGEPGNWHGAEPVRKCIEDLRAQVAAKSAAPVTVARMIADIRAARSMARRDQIFEELIQVLEAPMPATQAPAAVGDAFAWLVELRPAFEGHPNFPATYYAGWMTDAMHAAETQDAYAAARFVRQQDAQKTAEKLPHTLSCVWTAVEHGFVAPMPATQAPAAAEAARLKKIKSLKAQIKKLEALSFVDVKEAS